MQLKHIIIIKFVTAFMIMITFGVIYFFNWLRGSHFTINHYTYVDKKYQYYVQVLISFIISLINFALGKALLALTINEQNWTYTAFYTSNARKLTWALFMNSGIILLIINYNFTTIGYNYGLIYDIRYYLWFSAFFNPVYYVFNPWYYLKLY